MGNRARLKEDMITAVQLREVYPWLAEVRIELEFADGTRTTPSAQAYAFYAGARSFFRIACPYHDCSGEFDLSTQVAELAALSRDGRRSRNLDLTCTGHRARRTIEGCPISARIRVSAVPAKRSSEDEHP